MTTFKEVMTDYIQGFSMISMVPENDAFGEPLELSLGCGSSQAIPATSGKALLVMEFTDSLSRELERANDIPQKAQPFVIALAELSSLLRAPSGQATPEALSVLSADDADMLEEALNKLVETSSVNTSLEKFSIALRDGLTPAIKMAREESEKTKRHNEKLSQMIQGLEDLFEDEGASDENEGEQREAPN